MRQATEYWDTYSENSFSGPSLQMFQWPLSTDVPTQMRPRICLPYYSEPCVLRSAIQVEKYGLKLKVVLKWRDNPIEKRLVSLIAGLKWKGIVKLKVLKSRGHCISNTFRSPSLIMSDNFSTLLFLF